MGPLSTETKGCFFINLGFDDMAQLYEDPQRTTTAEAVLHTLQQGGRGA